MDSLLPVYKFQFTTNKWTNFLLFTHNLFYETDNNLIYGYVAKPKIKSFYKKIQRKIDQGIIVNNFKLTKVNY